MPRKGYVKQKVEGKKSAPIHHATVGKTLRALGLLPKGYRLDRLTRNQKDRITKTARKYSTQVNHPAFFTPIKVRPQDLGEIKKLGIPVRQRTALFQVQGAEAIKYDPRKGTVTRTYQGKEQVTILPREQDIFREAEKIFANLKPGEYVTLRVGDKSTFGTRIRSMKDFRRYRKIVDERYGKGTWKRLTPTLQIVTLEAGLKQTEAPRGSQFSTLKPIRSNTGASRKRSR